MCIGARLVCGAERKRDMKLSVDQRSETSCKGKVAILYHYMYPDDVVSAQHMDGLAAGLVSRGWKVKAWPSNRGCRNDDVIYPPDDSYQGVEISRIWRPRFKQASFWGRLANSAVMISAWCRLAFLKSTERPDIVIVGTDPIFAVIVAIPLKLFAPNMVICHWCFDLHPEAAFANGLVSEKSFLSRIICRVLKAAYRNCDLMVDIGPAMRRRLRRYDHKAKEVQLTPWALREPPSPTATDSAVRTELFGDASLGLLYSGNFGEAHSFTEVLSLARTLRDHPTIKFCFAVRGNKVAELKAAVTDEDVNICFAPFAPIEQLEKRLGAADIHIASLHEKWAGIAVPSKFFGSLAVGRPVLYAGAIDSDLGEWVKRFRVGWRLDEDTVSQVAKELIELAKNAKLITEFQARAHKVYEEHYSQQAIIQRWSDELEKLNLERPDQRG